MTRILLALVFFFPFLAYSQPYPSKPIRLIVTYPAGGGADLVAKSAPDGHTLMLDATNHAVNPSLLAKLPYDPDKAFAPVTLLAIAITGSKRSPAAPDLPTVAESGMPGYQVYEWNAIFAPAGTPAAIANRLQSEIAKVVRIPEVRDRMLALGGEIVASSPADLGAWVREQTASWRQVVKAANIKPE